MSEKGGQQVSFNFQIGLVKDKVTVDITASTWTLKYLKTLAVSFVNEKFPDHEVTRLDERLLVFRHDYSCECILQVFKNFSLKLKFTLEIYHCTHSIDSKFCD